MQDIAKERLRLRAEIARDKELRKANKGVLPSVLGVDGCVRTVTATATATVIYFATATIANDDKVILIVVMFYII